MAKLWSEWTKEEIKELLMTNDRAVERALLVLVERQTQDEKRSETTKYHNEMGFAPCDARMMTSMANFVSRGRHLTPKQLAWLRNGKSERFPSRICKYAGQILKTMEEKNNK